MLTMTAEQRMRDLLSEFDRRRPEFLRQKPGRFLVLAEGDVKGDFATAGEALASALASYQEGDFIIKQVVEAEVFRFVNAFVGPPKR